MKIMLLSAVGLLCSLWATAQAPQEFPDEDFTFAASGARAVYMKRYDKDTAAGAVVLDEFGKTFIDNSQKNILVHYRHVMIKILNDRGISEATFEIPVYKSMDGGGAEEVYNVKAHTYNQEADGMQDIPFKQRDIFRETKSRTADLIKFTLPGVKAGSIIDVSYNLSSPFIRNFRGWDFQSDIPKIRSRYWAKIPANFDYHISLNGYLKLDEDDRDLVKGCLVVFNGGQADCTLMKLGMKDIPAFREEPYMPARSNYLSAVHFELSQVKNFNGSVDKLTNTWGDLDKQLAEDKDFGVQLKRGPSLLKDLSRGVTAGDTSDVARARHLYRYFQKTFRWDDYRGVFLERGIKKLLDSRAGNVADINVALVAALRSLGLKASPVLVSTRDNGIPREFYPALTDFNYIVARLEIAGNVYMLDATRRELPFGMIPLECVNGKGRVIPGRKPSEWLPMSAPQGFNEVDVAQLFLTEEGKLTGQVTRTFTGYAALHKRRDIRGYSSLDDYLDHVTGRWPGFTVTADSLRDLDKVDEALVETSEVSFDKPPGPGSLALNPFFSSMEENPFKATERHYPIDFGTTERNYSVISLHYPPGYRLASMPRPTNLALPDQGGRYIVQVDSLAGLVIIKALMEKSKPYYLASQYGALKQLYNLIVQSQRAEVVFAKNEISR
jgi:hypothetical protein